MAEKPANLLFFLLTATLKKVEFNKKKIGKVQHWQNLSEQGIKRQKIKGRGGGDGKVSGPTGLKNGVTQRELLNSLVFPLGIPTKTEPFP